MIIINNKEYNNISTKVSFGHYDVVQDGIKRDGESIMIEFKLDDVFLGIETTYDKNWLNELTIDTQSDISKYISDITYEDENGWVSLATGTYNCFITRTDQNTFLIELNCEAEECDEKYVISLKESIIL